ncbi:hypothetical protein C8034_v003071 [Colletotrichum sidae]|uniref:Glycine-rich domain-containing protein 1 n=1 Tax=Colletotrichum sidae TaxID=1347389 RepID=A0A4V3I253_9PEZI|nr:hypothetical protein C8034_v003071 [Colletotrichum sidae]
MHSLFKWPKSKEKEAEAEAEAERARNTRAATPPPTYESAQDDPPAFEDAPPSFESIHGSKSSGKGDKKARLEQDVVDLTATFSSLRFETQKDPDVDSCLAHLKLLYAIQTLKEEVGYTDGLWNLWDSRAGPLPDSEKAASSKESEDRVKDVLAKIREKRWAVYLARAVDRYETWWKALSPYRLREEDMKRDDEKYATFADGGADFPWTLDVLPPLDVLMIWHSHMLNPRAFLEDTMRWGLRAFWTTGMPWAQVNQAIDSKFNYTGTEAAKANWEAATGKSWDNVQDPMTKSLECPACKQLFEVLWTTCGLPETYKGDEKPGIVGAGYGDGSFSQVCTAGCETLVTRYLLSVAKMVQDTEDYLNHNYTVPSSVLDPKVGTAVSTRMKLVEVTFPNRVLGLGVVDELRKLIVPGTQTPPSMENVKYIIEAGLADDAAYKRMQGRDPLPIEGATTASGRILTRTQRFGTRKMMSRYWDNYSIFALDLVGATMRQGVFVDKMYNIDWLQGPAPRGVMDRLLQKYHRFMLVMTENTLSLCVPTLDVDLAWHTHQLAPRAYYRFSTFNTATHGVKEARFIDHNDKIDEMKLSSSFERTSLAYLNKFNDVYSQCVCAYCEATRVFHTLNTSNLFGRTKQQKAIDNFTTTTEPTADPTTAIHVSNHNAVRSNESAVRKRYRSHARVVYKTRLDDSYERAYKRAAKKGKTLPPREEYYCHWDSKYHLYGPCAYPAYLTTGIYINGDPGIMHAGADGWAGCAQGLCGTNDIPGGGCGGPGGCTSLDLSAAALSMSISTSRAKRHRKHRQKRKHNLPSGPGFIFCRDESDNDILPSHFMAERWDFFIKNALRQVSPGFDKAEVNKAFSRIFVSAAESVEELPLTSYSSIFDRLLWVSQHNVDWVAFYKPLDPSYECILARHLAINFSRVRQHPIPYHKATFTARAIDKLCGKKPFDKPDEMFASCTQGQLRQVMGQSCRHEQVTWNGNIDIDWYDVLEIMGGDRWYD